MDIHKQVIPIQVFHGAKTHLPSEESLWGFGTNFFLSDEQGPMLRYRDVFSLIPHKPNNANTHERDNQLKKNK
jgi:hypothetical protein